jgi:hypothetical protein
MGVDAMKRQLAAALVVALVGFAGTARADDKANPTGTWKWETEINGQKRESTLKLKLEDGKLTGAMLGRNNMETKIDDGKFKDGEISFSLTRERNGQKFTSKYKGKLEGDTIKGKIEFERNGEAMSRDWEAKRSKE